MKKGIRRIYVSPLVLAALMAACSSEPENTNTNNNTAPGSPVAQSGTVAATSEASPPAVTPAPQPASPSTEDAKSEAAHKAAVAGAAQPAPSGRQPKLIVPTNKIDFGKQPQSTSLARMITIRNGGKAPLNIAAVEPS